MDWLIITSVLIVFLLAAFVWNQQKSIAKKTKQSKNSHKPAPTHGKYHCVTVHSSSIMCEGIKQLQNKSLLPHEAPALPLTNCTNHHCQCHYTHHEDRRIRNRREPYGELNNGSSLSSIDRPLRSRTDRRKATKPP